MTEHINLNNDWKYSDTFHKELILKSFDESKLKEVRIPHTNVETPFHYFDEKIYQFVSGYRRNIAVKKDWRGKHVLLTFEGVGHTAKVYVNETLVTTHFGGYTAFTVDISQYLIFEVEELVEKAVGQSNLDEDAITLRNANIIVVEVDSREDQNVPPFGNVIDYLTYGGIYREVYLEVKNSLYIEDAFITTKDTEKEEKQITFSVALKGQPSNHISMKYSIEKCMEESIPCTLLQGMVPIKKFAIEITKVVSGAINWDIEEPILYQLKLELWKSGALGKESLCDVKIVRFGFRTCEFKENGFYLNHKKIKLIGLNRHQSFPYVGYAMPKRMQRRDAELLKEELCVNAVRTSHYPQSKHFINRCDELGLLVFTELPGWQHIGDNRWKEIACENVSEMVLQYRNHPSIILWGVRINESQDDDEFYKETNRIAHELDHTRQTGGVRYIKKSNLLEDVYTYNDFLHNGATKGLDRKKNVTSKKQAPYMVTEFNGHMFPTKSFDSEEHRLQHALRHACVLDALFEQKNIVGGFGWCMFDYNTHKDFGSGDKICYHGVLDMFRNPKLAASVYASQNDKTNICEVSSSLDIGDHPAGNIGDVYAFTNADSIKLYKNDIFIKKFYPSKTKNSHLPHPPILINDFVGDLLEKNENYGHKTAEALKEILFAIKKDGPNNLPLRYKIKMAFLMLKEHMNLEEGTRLYNKYIGNWGDSVTTFRFEAIKDQKIVKVIEKKPVNQPRLIMSVDTTWLQEEETYDVVGIRITMVDESGNHLSYYQEPITLEAWGAIELIGPKTISLKGGSAGSFVKTKGIKGVGGVRITQENLGVTEIKFQVL